MVAGGEQVIRVRESMRTREEMRRFLEYVTHCRLKTCCFVAPVRGGLVCLASINCVVALVQLLGGMYSWEVASTTLARVQLTLAREQAELKGEEEVKPPSPLANLLPPVADLAANTVLLFALYRLDVVLLRAYCFYILVTLWLTLLFYALLETYVKTPHLVIIALNGAYQIYILLLVWSLMVELKSEKNEVMKGEGMVFIRDAESPYPGVTFPASPGSTLPAITHPGIATSITTLNTVHEGNLYMLADSEYNTLNKNNSLKVSTLKPSKMVTDTADIHTLKPSKMVTDTADIHALKPSKMVTDTADIHTPKSSTLPAQNTATTNAPKLEAMQSLACTSKTMSNNPEAVKQDTASTRPTNACAEKALDVKPDNIRSVKPSVKTADVKTVDAPKKIKRGIFRKAPKEKNAQKNITIPDSAAAEEPDGKTNTTSNELMTQTIEAAASEADDKKPEGNPKKNKRSLFSRTAKET